MAARATGRTSPSGSTASASSRRSAPLAGYAYEHPADPFPDDRRARAALRRRRRSAHPLIASARSARTTCALDADTRVLVVSGSNMSGKSTLLRTVGVATVLALAGAPVRARRLPLSPLAVGATLRVQDSLQAGKSRFFAEITRLRAIVDQTSGPLPVLFLLDELLAGTNSHDRRVGATSVVRGLRRARRHRPGDDARSGAGRTGVDARRRAPRTCTSATRSKAARSTSTTRCGRASCGRATRSS